jgi:hypothetical protein
LKPSQRGEADAEWAIAGLNARIQRVDSTLEADVVRSLDGTCCLTITGADNAVDGLLERWPRACVAGGFRPRRPGCEPCAHPLPARAPAVAGRPRSPLTALHEAYV